MITNDSKRLQKPTPSKEVIIRVYHTKIEIWCYSRDSEILLRKIASEFGALFPPILNNASWLLFTTPGYVPEDVAAYLEQELGG